MTEDNRADGWSMVNGNPVLRVWDGDCAYCSADLTWNQSSWSYLNRKHICSDCETDGLHFDANGIDGNIKVIYR
jgi:hypothetical protein